MGGYFDAKAVLAKDEAIMYGDVYFDGFSSSPAAAGGGLVSDFVDAPPFLKKTFQMVEDKETDGIISWSCSGKSFVVWDPFTFSSHLLPTYFKHNNFSSFIRQLNTYGFKKVDSGRWEFAHEGFQGGKRQLLRNIKRRKQQPQQQIQGGREAEVIMKELKRDQAELKMEVLKMKELQQRTNANLANMEDRIQRREYEQRKMFLFMARAFASPLFLRQIIRNLRQQRQNLIPSESQTRKRCRLINQEQELGKMEREVTVLSYDTMDGSSSSSSSTYNTNPFDNTEYILWEKLLEDDMIICEEDDEADIR